MSAMTSASEQGGRIRRPIMIRVFLAIWLVGLALAHVAPAKAQGSTSIDDDALAAAVAWLVDQQAADGGFPVFDGTSDPGTTCDAVYALAAAARHGLDVAAPLERAWAFLRERAVDFGSVGTGQSAKLALAAVAVGQDPTIVGDARPIEWIQEGVDAESGRYGASIFDHALALLALAAADQVIPESAFDLLATTQIADGSWAFDGSTAEGSGDGNTTALVIQALVAAGRADSPLVQPAITYLASLKGERGGFAYASGGEPDANSTGLAVQALIAVGTNPAVPDVPDVARALVAFQNPSGAFRYQDAAPDDNLFATVQVIPALAGLPLPVTPGDERVGARAA